MQIYSPIVALFAAITASTTLAIADITEYQVAKLRVYEQTSSAPPSVPVVYVFDAYIDASPGDIGSASINGQAMDNVEPGTWELNADFGTQGELDAAAPGSVFTMSIQSGTLGNRTETLNLPVPENYPQAPAITQASYDAGQGADPDQDLAIQWEAPDTNTNLVFLTVFDVESDADIFDDTVPVGQTSFVIDSSLLLPDHTYEVEIGFANGTIQNGTPGTGFGKGATEVSGYAAITIALLTTGNGIDTAGIDAGVLKGVKYRQLTANTQPVSPESYEFESFLITGPDELTEGELIGGAFDVPFFEFSPGAWGIDGSSTKYASKPEIDADFPSSTTYSMMISGGSLGDRSQDFFIGPDGYPEPIFLTGTVLDELQGMDPSIDFVLTWSLPDPEVGLSAVFIDDVALASKVFEMILPSPGVTELTIPAGLLEPGVNYEIGLTVFNAQLNPGDGFPGFEPETICASGFLTDTLISFATQSLNTCVADLNNDGELDFIDISSFLSAYTSLDPLADLNDDGNFDFIDISAFLGSYSEGCP